MIHIPEFDIAAIQIMPAEYWAALRAISGMIIFALFWPQRRFDRKFSYKSKCPSRILGQLGLVGQAAMGLMAAHDGLTYQSQPRAMFTLLLVSIVVIQTSVLASILDKFLKERSKGFS